MRGPLGENEGGGAPEGPGAQSEQPLRFGRLGPTAAREPDPAPPPIFYVL